MPLLAAPFRLSPHEIPLGTLLRNPYDLGSKYQALVTVLPPDLCTSVPEPKLSTRKDVVGGCFPITYHFEMRAGSTHHIYFQPSPAYLKECAALPELLEDCGAETGYATAYLVVNLEIAEDLSVEMGHTRNHLKRDGLRFKKVSVDTRKTYPEASQGITNNTATLVAQTGSLPQAGLAGAAATQDQTHRIYSYAVKEFTFTKVENII